MRPRTTWMLTIAAAVVGSILFTASVGALASTDAAWTDRAYTSVPVTAGTWTTAPVASTCTAMNASGKPLPNATCAITGVRFTQWTDGSGNTVRDYYIAYSMSNSGKYPSAIVNLAAATGTGTWTWGRAAVVGTGQFTLMPGFSCAELPTLRVDGPSGWGAASEFWVRIVQDKASPLGTTGLCG